MADLVKQICHEGTLPGKTLSRYGPVTRRYLLNSSTFTLRNLDVELVRAVSLPECRPDSRRLAFEITDACTVSVLVKDNAVTAVHHLTYSTQNFTDIGDLNR